EPFLFFLALSMPSRAVVLSYSASDGNGNPLPVSPFITELNRILKDATVERIAPEAVAATRNCFAPAEFLRRAAADSTLDLASVMGLSDTAEIDSVLRRTGVERRRERYFELPTREELVDARRKAGAQRTSAPQWLGVNLSPD